MIHQGMELHPRQAHRLHQCQVLQPQLQDP
uniref:Uncharacterized protein n=1 Tax=Myoviridae sp. ct3wi9 TaxID=2826610 RepID=A0A8S5MXR4_9CAUD|nr:MAG TPA: hypothetical protein [Myoviridae sp. ct3wi9]DAK41823.1 MAG TPA: hypothetical protein [Caudoviricetes sp.]DAM51546.1 MAG TPA: hypothetical protein [Caudoviricetes sp.]DAM96127.1 MAG TPA: hypothetical protein [Caudoviricetes sp.]DAN83022.1 MAG TPA: hypothetical protein [Caudoviricetes sp.]